MKFVVFINLAIFSFFNSSAVQAADISYSKFWHSYIVSIDGAIVKGDYDKFIKTLSKVFTLAASDFHSEMNKAKTKEPKAYKEWVEKYGTPKGAARVTLSLNSLGGDVVEAIKIGKATRDMLLKTDTGWQTRNDDFRDFKCMSACFFIWVSGIDRSAIYRNGEKPLGIHRLYFEKDYYKNLTSKQAEVKYKKLKISAIQFIEEMDVPQKYIDKMFSVPSNDVYMISQEEIDNLEGKTPYYEELMFSRCGTYTKQEDNDYMECLIKENSNKCSNMSPGYLSYIESKIEKTHDCWRVHDGIERWKRMSSHLNINTTNIK